jgi:hypothetical protein
MGDAAFSILYIDVEYMDRRALRRVLELAKEGLPVCLKGAPMEPGYIKSGDYTELLNQLKSLDNVSNDLSEVVDHPAFITGERIPAYWCRVELDGTHYVFLAQKGSKDLTYPVYCGQSFMDQSDFMELTLNLNGVSITRNFEFKPYQSLMLRISPEGSLDSVDITYEPNDPVIRPREEQRMYF